MAVDKILGTSDINSVADSVFAAVSNQVSEVKAMQQRKAAENVQVVIEALKKIEGDMRGEFGDIADKLAERISTIKDGQDGYNGVDGRAGKDGRAGRDGLAGKKGNDGLAGQDGVNGVDGVSVINAYIDFDGSLVIELSNGRVLNVGDVVSQDLADKINVIQTMSTNSAVGIKDEGSSISTGVKNINFVGATVTATASGDDVTVNVSAGTGTVTSVAATAGTGISVTGSPITTSGTLNITNTAPDQIVSLTGSGATTVTGTYPSFTIASTGGGTVTSVAATAGTGISITGSPITTSGTLNIVNSAPDQTVVLTGAGTTSITGTYPNFTVTSNDAFTGTVTSVTGTSPVASSGGATPAISLASGYGDTLNPYASKTANFVLAAPNGTAGVPTFRAVVANDIPTLNQNTTGTAATVTTTINSGVVATTQTAGDNSTKVATTAYVNAITGTSGSMGFRNRIINGDMRIDQRNAGAAVTVNDAAAYVLDRYFAQDATDGIFTVEQSLTAPAGFANSMLITVTTADASLGAGQLARIVQRVEGFNMSDLAWGTASAATIELSFQVRSSVTGTFGGSISNAAFNRSYPFSYTINSANTFEQKSITIDGDTTGTWLKDNGIGLEVNFGLGVGSTFSGTANAWTGSGLMSSTGAVNLMATNGATFFITGVQLEAGSVASPFERRDIGRELMMCQRYCPVFDASTGTGARILGYGRSTTSTDISFTFPVTLRAPPTGITVSSASNFNIFNPANSGSGVLTALTFGLGDIQGSICAATTTVATPTIAAGNLLQLFPISTSAKIIFNGCEL